MKNIQKTSLILIIGTAALFLLSFYFADSAQAAGYGWVNPQTVYQDCSNGLSKIRFESRERDNDNSADAGNMVGEIRKISDGSLVTSVSGSTTTSTTGCVVDPFKHYFVLSVAGNSSYKGLWTWFTLFNPGNFTNKLIPFHVHVQPVEETAALRHSSPGKDVWVNSDPDLVVNIQNLVTAHGAKK